MFAQNLLEMFKFNRIGWIFGLTLCGLAAVASDDATSNNNQPTAVCDQLNYVPTCSSNIYCYGNLLDTVQMARIYNDSKTFVDMRQKNQPNVTLQNYADFIAAFPTPTANQTLDFVNQNFDSPGSEFVNYVPVDHTSNPAILSKIADGDYRSWASDLNDLWLTLGRKMTDDVKTNPTQYSIIYVENPVIIPGGRFREFYYWDSYWIIKGLLQSEMYVTVKGMIQNFVSMIETYGFVPNGGRIYYTGRSQPPLFTPLVKAYLDATNDWPFVQSILSFLETEFMYWVNNHYHYVVKGHTLFSYSDRTCGPRPESYFEDITSALLFNTSLSKELFYSEIKSTASSGMDFCSRWFITNGTNAGDLNNVQTKSIIPVDLNAYLFMVAKYIYQFYLRDGNLAKAEIYENYAITIYSAINAVLWQPDLGIWLDWDVLDQKRREYFVPSNLIPLYAGCYDPNESQELAEIILTYIANSGLAYFDGGIPNTLDFTTQQWDFPNAWPPMQYLIVMGLDKLNNTDASALAFNLAAKWTRTNWLGYNATQLMFEKYDARFLGLNGGGGEYGVQTGFGWTNGVILEFLNKYGSALTATDDLQPAIDILAKYKSANDDITVESYNSLTSFEFDDTKQLK